VSLLVTLGRRWREWEAPIDKQYETVGCSHLKAASEFLISEQVMLAVVRNGFSPHGAGHLIARVDSPLALTTEQIRSS
jgi:RNA 3'-terminal phosphate cyclase